MYKLTAASPLFLLLSFVFPMLATVSFASDSVNTVASCEDISCGLELWHEDGSSIMAPALSTSVQINISGAAVHTLVTQSFSNQSPHWVEGIYSYPLPTGAAVNSLRMKIGDREIIGKIQERKQAEKTYAKAKASGRKASLVKSHRPNLFTTKLANLGPNESVEISIEYFTELPLSAGTQQYRFPMVVGPRYVTTTPSSVEALAHTTEFALQNEPHEGGQNIPTLPTDLPAIPTISSQDVRYNSLSLEVNLNLGVSLEALSSLYHEVHIQRTGGTDYSIRLADGPVVPNRDFVLEFSPLQNSNPQTALLSEKKNGFQYGLFLIMPPKANKTKKLPREVTFIVDRSGSMGGTSIVQAKAALIHALDELSSEDRFNIVSFNNNNEALFPTIVAASDGNLNRAKAFVAQLHASGGTEMMGALKTAFNAEGSSEHVQQFVFITDGNVSNEASLFNFIENNLGRLRLFTIGIGSAPNQYFLEHAATAGRGLHTFIGDTSEIQSRMHELFAKLKQPMLRDIEIIDESGTLEFWPQVLPDLYADEPIVIAFRTKSSTANLKLSGKLPSQHWRATVSLDGGQQRQGLAELWAKRKITYLMNEYRRNVSEPEKQKSFRQDIVDTALTHHLVSKFTSLVAVEKTPSNPQLTANQTKRVPRHMPHGWTGSGGNSQLPQTGTDARIRIILGALSLLLITVTCCRGKPTKNELTSLRNV